MPQAITYTPNFYALLICIRGKNPGAASDVQMIKKLLGKAPYPIQSIVLLDDGSATAEVVLNWLEKFAISLKAGDRLYFYITAHGDRQQTNIDEDEKDGMDEYLVMDKGSILVDNDIFTRLCLFAAGTEIVFIVDACSSGTSYKVFKPHMLLTRYNFPNKLFQKNWNSNILKAQIIYMGAAFDGGLAQPGNDGSVFTKKIFQIANAYPESSFRKVFGKVYKSISAHQTPVYTEISDKGINTNCKKDQNIISNSFRDQPAFPG